MKKKMGLKEGTSENDSEWGGPDKPFVGENQTLKLHKED